MSNITIGTKVEGNWGAMLPTSEGKVIYIKSDDVTIEWDSDDDEFMRTSKVKLDQIHQPGWTSVNGSPIGIFVVEDNNTSILCTVRGCTNEATNQQWSVHPTCDECATPMRKAWRNK